VLLINYNEQEIKEESVESFE